MATKFLEWKDPGRAIITGASSGIGAGFSRRLAGMGFRPVLVARRREKLEELASQISSTTGLDPEIIPADLSDEAQTMKLVETVASMADVDLLVNNAGFGIPGGFMGARMEENLAMVAVHVMAPVRLARAVAPAMKTRGRGGIINTASLAAFNPAPGLYSPTKAFLLSFSEGLSMELDGTGVRVQALCPGFTHTGFHDSPELSKMKARTPKKAWGTVDQVVAASIKGLRSNKPVVVPGLVNKVILAAPRKIRKGVTMKEVRRQMEET